MFLSALRWKIAITAFLIICSSAIPASAAVYMSSFRAPSVIADPMGGFNIEYNLGGSKTGVGAATALVTFYVSTSPTGSTGAAVLTSYWVGLNGYGAGPYVADTRLRTSYIHPINLSPAGVSVLQSLANSCQPQSLYILADVDYSRYYSTPARFGTVKPPDFFFTAGTLSPSSIVPGGATNISFDLFTRCPATTSSRVGIYLTDESFNPLSFIGAVGIGAGAGTFSLPPTSIAFSPSVPLGSYRILLISDVDGWISESNENNNSGWFSLNVVSGVQATARRAGGLTSEADLPVDVAGELRDLEGAPADDYTVKFAEGLQSVRK